MASVQKRPDGRWRARYRDTAGREHAKHFGRKIDAQQWLNEVTASVITGTYVDPRAGRVTFADFYREWAVRQVWVAGTRRAMDTAAAVPFAAVQLRLIRRSHVESWVKGMATATTTRKALAPGTIHTRYVNVRSVFRAAVADRVIPTDPSEGVTLPRRRRQDQAMRIPSPDEVGRLLRAASPEFAVFVALCAFAGLRLGEACGVQVGDVDFLRRQLHIRRQVQRERGTGLEVRLPKYGSERVVMLADELVELLAAYVAEHRPDGEPGRWLFVVSPVGEETPPHQNTITHRWARTTATAGVQGVRLHDLRHFFASGLIAAGCDVVTVQRALGHSSAATTLGVYSHLWPSAEDRTRAAAGQIFRETLGSADSGRTRGVT